MPYKAFISYSHAADGKLAPALQFALHRFACPWYALRAMRVFRDQTNLSISPHLWTEIENSLADSMYFILLASPQSAASKWVRQEVDFWLKNRSADKLLIIVTDGDVIWDSATGDFDWAKTTALSQNLAKAFSEEPLYLDFRWAKTSKDLSLNNPAFREKIADLASTLHDRPKDELIGEDIRQHRKVKRLTWSAVTALIALTLFSVSAAWIAVTQRDQAVSRELAALSISQLTVDPELSLLLAIEAADAGSTIQAEDALRQSLGELHVRAVMVGHTNSVPYAKFSADVRWVVTASTDHTSRVWEASTGKLISKLQKVFAQIR